MSVWGTRQGERLRRLSHAPLHYLTRLAALFMIWGPKYFVAKIENFCKQIDRAEHQIPESNHPPKRMLKTEERRLDWKKNCQRNPCCWQLDKVAERKDAWVGSIKTGKELGVVPDIGLLAMTAVCGIVLGLWYVRRLPSNILSASMCLPFAASRTLIFCYKWHGRNEEWATI